MSETKLLPKLDDVLAEILGDIKEPKKRNYLENYLKLGAVGKASEVTGVSPATPWWWREKDPIYKEAFTLIERLRSLMAVERLEAELDLCAYDEKMGMPKVVAILARLKAEAPGKYKDDKTISPTIDNRQINIYVTDNEAKDLLAKVGERTKRITEG